MTLGMSIQQVVDIFIRIPPDADDSPGYILKRIQALIWSKHNVALDRGEFEDCFQARHEAFDEF